MKSPENFGVKMFTYAAFAYFAATASTVSAQSYYNGFEVDVFDWTSAERVPSGTGGVPSAAGGFHARAAPETTPFTRFGGYTTTFPAGGYDTSIDIYLDVDAEAANDTRFDWISAINDAAGAFRRDFVFNAGFYNAGDETGPGAGTNRFVVSASTNSGRGSAFPKNPGNGPIAISSTGWYTFRHEFRKDAADVLVVQLSILDAARAQVGTWTISDPSDIIGVTIGGNRYGWFALNELSLQPSTPLSFDEVFKTDVSSDPTVGPIGVEEIELGDGQNLVRLSAKVDDADGQLLDVTWSIDGVVEESETGVAPGTVVEFESDFPLGASAVTVSVTDGSATATAGTTVTVADTIGPVVIVTPDVTIPTDPGKDFATGVVLTPPAVADNYDLDPTLTNDAPAKFPLGTTDVTWTATDSAGNETDAVQHVTVADEEAPKIGAVPAVRVPVDRGKAFATVDLDEPDVRDNVDDDVPLENDAPARFPVGRTEVVWTATDEAGNESSKLQIVIVENEAPVADAGSDLRVQSTKKSGARVRLDGRGSFDPDAQKLKFDWSAPDIDFDDPTVSRPIATFPVGKTDVRLVVTDEVGVRSSDTVTVFVSFDQKLVAETRPYSAYVTPYVDASVSTLDAYATQDTASQPLAYAASFAEYAKFYDQAANDVRYRDDNLGSQTGVYLSLRYYQVYFSAYAATYAYYGSGASDGYYYAAAAQYYGQADLDY